MNPLQGFAGLVMVLGVVFLASLHQVEEGHLGVYFRGGAMLQKMSEPGFHMMIPFVTEVRNIQTTLEAMAVNNKFYFGPDIPNMFISEKDGAGDSQRTVSITSEKKVL